MPYVIFELASEGAARRVEMRLGSLFTESFLLCFLCFGLCVPISLFFLTLLEKWRGGRKGVALGFLALSVIAWIGFVTMADDAINYLAD